VLGLVAAHSAAIGLGLCLQPPAFFALLGFAPVSEPFFPAQGGMMHLILAAGYGLGAQDPVGRRALVVYAVFVKTAAALFLFVYWLFVSRQWSVLASGVVDGLMALVIAAAHARCRQASAAGRR